MPRFRRSSFVCVLTLSVLSLACQQPTATPPPVSTAPPAATVPPDSHTIAQPDEAELKVAYPGLQTLSEAFPEGSLTIDAQDAATRGTLLLASVFDKGRGLERGYDLERTADGSIVLSFFAAVERADEIYSGDEIGPSYFVQIQCSEEQANALRKRPVRSPLLKVVRYPIRRVIFRLSSASARSSDDQRSRVLRGTLIAVSPFDNGPD
jgi:hypothetical protein